MLNLLQGQQKPRTDFNSVSTGFHVNMEFFVSLQKLLFTHKPLDTSDKGVQVQSYQNLINEGFEILQTRMNTRL